MSGPYETEREARGAVRHILDSAPGTGAWQQGNHKLLEDACTAAGVTLGAYDHRILLWLAGWEPQTVAVVAGLISRADRRLGGYGLIVQQALLDAVRYRAARVDDQGDPGGNREQIGLFRSAARDLGLRVPSGDPGAGVLLGGQDVSTALSALEVAADELRDRAANCADCETSPAELCGTCESRLERAEEFGRLAERLRDRP